MAWLFSAYAIDGTEPPISHRHHIGTQNQKHRSLLPRQHIQHVTVISKQEVQRQNQVLLRPSTKTLPFGIPSIEPKKKISSAESTSESINPRSSSLFTSNIKHHFARTIASKQSVLATQISYLTQTVVENLAEPPSRKITSERNVQEKSEQKNNRPISPLSLNIDRSVSVASRDYSSSSATSSSN